MLRQGQLKGPTETHEVEVVVGVLWIGLAGTEGLIPSLVHRRRNQDDWKEG